MPSSSEDSFRKALSLFQAGKLADAERQFKKVLRHYPRHVAALNLLSSLLTHLERYDEAERYIKLAVEADSSSDVTFYNYGIILKALKRPLEALERFNRALEINAGVAETWNNCGIVLNDLKLYDDAIAKFDRAIQLQPNYSEAFFNKGNSLARLQRLEAASEAYAKALSLKPDLAEAWLARANIFAKLMRDEEARQAYQRALAIKPNLFEALIAVGARSLSEGDIVTALDLARRALTASERTEAKALVAQCLCSPLLHPDAGDLLKLLLRASVESWAHPAELAPAYARFLMLNDTVRTATMRAVEAWPRLLPATELSSGASSLEEFAEARLLCVLLESVPVSGFELECLATALRSALLTSARTDPDSALPQPILNLYCALARQCFMNNYVFAQSDEETEQVHALRNSLVGALASHAPVSTLSLAAVAAYIPLHTLPNREFLLGRSWPDVVSALLEQQVRAPIEEQRLRSSIPALTAIDDGVSVEVRDQYEESPYPQWVKATPRGEPTKIDLLVGEMFPFSPYVKFNKTAIDVLIAGCGTGRHAIDTARRFEAAQVLAIDLSMTSLCFAARLTRSFGLDNIQYAQADIMKLGTLERTFDVIESVGVLHHLAKPFAGWSALLSLLRPGGLMRLGLYSEIARRDVVAGRNFIAEQGYRPTASDIRRCRQEMFKFPDGSSLGTLTRTLDFFSLNECRDLLFHAQEHRMTLPQISTFLTENGLEFLGFDIDLRTRRDYARRFPGDTAMTDLAQWHRYETDNPYTFSQMYQFWVQRK